MYTVQSSMSKMILITTILLGSLIHSLSAVSNKSFPESFAFGSGTSAYQVEGGWNLDGKGESMWDRFVHSNPQKFPETGDVACDSYHKWQEDVQNVKNLGLKFYRFSLSWPRIMPNGTANYINPRGVDYYLNLIKALKANGIEPLVTIFHWDLPEYLQELGGFLNSGIVDYYADFARFSFEKFGPYVKYWLTFNEPHIFCSMGYNGRFPPGYVLNGDANYQCGHNLLKAHAKAYHAYRREFRPTQNGSVSIVLNGNWYRPKNSSNPLDVEAQNRAMQFELGWFGHPVYVGNYSEVMIHRVAHRSKTAGYPRSRLPKFTEEEVEEIRGTADFFCLNTYGWLEVAWQDELPADAPNVAGDVGVTVQRINTTNWPHPMRHLLNWIDQQYKPSAIVITENGIADDGTLEDDIRIAYIQNYLSDILEAIHEDQLPVRGYFVWSLMDNYEWGTYSKKFGILQVDFNSANRTRTSKKSAFWYKNVIEKRCLVDNCE